MVPHTKFWNIGIDENARNDRVVTDLNQTKAATLALADHHGPAYLRFGDQFLAR
jgi:hypothetical protein